jgi:CheY-like chemotaxis protein
MRFPDDFDDEEPTTPVEIEPRARVLLVEQDVDLRDSILDLMRRDYFEVIAADSGAEALDMLDDDELVEDIDLIVMDIDLPNAAGLEIVRTLRATRRGTPVVLIAGIDRPDILARAASLHVPVLSRPCVLEELSEVAIAALMGAH